MDILYSCKDFTVCVKPAGTDSEVGMPQALSSALGGEFFPRTDRMQMSAE